MLPQVLLGIDFAAGIAGGSARGASAEVGAATGPLERDRAVPIKRGIMKDLGWANAWGSGGPEEYLKCREAKHELHDQDVAPLHLRRRGFDTLYSCDICQIQWHVDSTD